MLATIACTIRAEHAPRRWRRRWANEGEIVARLGDLVDQAGRGPASQVRPRANQQRHEHVVWARAANEAVVLMYFSRSWWSYRKPGKVASTCTLAVVGVDGHAHAAPQRAVVGEDRVAPPIRQRASGVVRFGWL